MRRMICLLLVICCMASLCACGSMNFSDISNSTTKADIIKLLGDPTEIQDEEKWNKTTFVYPKGTVFYGITTSEKLYVKFDRITEKLLLITFNCDYEKENVKSFEALKGLVTKDYGEPFYEETHYSGTAKLFWWQKDTDNSKLMEIFSDGTAYCCFNY